MVGFVVLIGWVLGGGFEGLVSVMVFWWFIGDCIWFVIVEYCV